MVYAKVRLADVLPIESSGISSDLYDFALTAHYDFVITDMSQRPLFAVEFDGPQHELSKQAERDLKKDELSRRFMLALFRIDSHDLFRTESRLDRLTELTERWFAGNDNERFKTADRSFIPTKSRSGQSSEIPMKSSCPLCQAEMVMKNGKYGPFLSCIRFPQCKGSCDIPNLSAQRQPDQELLPAVNPILKHRDGFILTAVFSLIGFLLILAVASWIRLFGTQKVEQPQVEMAPAAVAKLDGLDSATDRQLDSATDRQINFLGVLIRRHGWSETDRDTQIEKVLGYRQELKKLNKKEASKLITAWDDRKRKN